MASCFPSGFNLRKQYLDNRNPTPLHCRKGSSHPEIETSNVFQPLLSPSLLEHLRRRANDIEEGALPLQKPPKDTPHITFSPTNHEPKLRLVATTRCPFPGSPGGCGKGNGMFLQTLPVRRSPNQSNPAALSPVR
ncbi:hypothetical protein CEXT_638341 [Caerostris extrusa]|uniref:Uncharacterized protein n=1 Tax=Caerostris extrusa TaxID=172846 RepID=A0AAV4SVD6_CAEEX|nr:hypothetical protein CEXT_638341 [Caerostris extrusa]